MYEIRIGSGCQSAELKILATALFSLADIRAANGPIPDETPSPQLELGLPTPIPAAPVAPPPAVPPMGEVHFTGHGMLPPAATSAPAVTPSPPAVPPNMSELDADGLPHDPRIHSDGRAKNADLRWRKRRNVSDEVVAAVTAELKAIVGAVQPAPPALPAGAHAEAPNVEPTVVDAAAVFGGTPAPVVTIPVPPPVPAFVPPTPIPAAAGDSPTTFNELMPRIMAAIGQNRIGQAQVHAACMAAGVPSLAGVSAAAAVDPTVIGRVWGEVQKAMVG